MTDLHCSTRSLHKLNNNKSSLVCHCYVPKGNKKDFVLKVQKVKQAPEIKRDSPNRFRTAQLTLANPKGSVPFGVATV